MHVKLGNFDVYCVPVVSGWLETGQPDPGVGGKALDLRHLYAELAQSLRVIVYNGDVDGQVGSARPAKSASVRFDSASCSPNGFLKIFIPIISGGADGAGSTTWV